MRIRTAHWSVILIALHIAGGVAGAALRSTSIALAAMVFGILSIVFAVVALLEPAPWRTRLWAWIALAYWLGALPLVWAQGHRLGFIR